MDSIYIQINEDSRVIRVCSVALPVILKSHRSCPNGTLRRDPLDLCSFPVFAQCGSLSRRR